MNKKYTVITSNIDWLELRKVCGHFELSLDAEELEMFEKFSEEEKLEFIVDNGDILVDDFMIDDYGGITEYEIENYG